MLRALGVAVAIFAVAKLSQHLTVPPSNASPVWPGAGVALAVTLVYGRRMLLGIFLGVLLFELQLFSLDDGGRAFVNELLLAAGLGLGAMVQALAGAELIRRVLGPLPSLVRDGDIVRFQLLGGPVACLVSASISMTVLWWFGVIGASNVSVGWLTWWVGDTIGVVIFAPLVLMVIAREQSSWRGRRTTVALPMLALLLAAIGFYSYSSGKESQAQQLRFREQVNNLHDVLQREFRNSLALLDSLGRYLDASEDVTEEEFRIFVAPAIGRHAGIQALEWIPRVPDAEREAFERSLPGGGPIRRLNRQGELIPAERRPEYYAIRFIEPPNDNTTAFGFDVTSNPTAAKALFQARDSGRATATSAMRLVQETANETGVVVYNPVYSRTNGPLDTPAQRQQAILGVTAAVFRLQSLVRRALPESGQGLIAIRLLDRTDPDAPELLFKSHAECFCNLPNGMRATHQFPIAERDWVLEYLATPEYLAANTTWAVWVVLTGGLLVTALAGTGLLMLTGRTLRREEEVIERTTELRAEVDQRRAAETQLRLVLEGARLGFWDQDVRSGKFLVNDRWLEILGLTRGDSRGDHANEAGDWTERIHPEDKPKTLAVMAKRLREESGSDGVEFRMRHQDGHWVWIHSAGAVVSRDAVSGEPLRLCGIHQDITERMQQQEQILRQAHFDALTELPNRFLVLDRLSQLLKDAYRNRERVAVLFLDLDDFKKVNDSLGHDTGDKLLKQAADRLSSVVRGGDTIGRLGGDEFIVLLGSLEDATNARPVAETLLSQFNAPFLIDNREMILTASIGISLYPDDGDTSSELLRNADSAMYHSKEQGRNTYSYFTDEMNRGVSRRLQLEEQMHGALSRHEFRVCYQPKVKLGNGRIVGAEALLRWHNPALGEVSPLELIPIAEHNGLIVPIGRFVLKEAVDQAAQWRRAFGDAFTMAVNLSPRQFRDPNLLDFIERTVSEAGVAAASLELEMTEGVLMSGYAQIDDKLAALNQLGVRIAMDDFGTGYSSLSYLRSYPFDVLKIDREFVSDVTHDAADQALVSAAIAMAHGLGLEVVAEGIETPEHVAFLRRQGCDFGQGYFFGKPMTAAEMTALLREQDGDGVA